MTIKKNTLIIPLIRKLPTSSGGIQKGVFQLYNYIRANGFDIEFFLNSNEEGITYYEDFKINHVQFPPIYTYPFSKRYFKYLKCKSNLFKYIQANYLDRDIIFVAHWAPDFILLSELGLKFNSKTIFSFHGPYHTNKFYQLYQRNQFWLKYINSQLDKINKFVFISNTLYNNAIENGSLPREKAIVITNGIVIKNNVETKENKVTKFVMVTRLVKNKNIDFVILAMCQLKTKGFNFACDIYGDGPEEKHLKELILSKGLNEYVVLKGYSSNIDKLLFNYDYYISASLFEGMPRGPLEAINNNVIPILSDIPTHREIIPLGIDVFFDHKDYLSLVDKIIDILNSDSLYLKTILKKNLTDKYEINIRLKKFHDLFVSLSKK